MSLGMTEVAEIDRDHLIVDPATTLNYARNFTVITAANRHFSPEMANQSSHSRLHWDSSTVVTVLLAESGSLAMVTVPNKRFL